MRDYCFHEAVYVVCNNVSGVCVTQNVNFFAPYDQIKVQQEQGWYIWSICLKVLFVSYLFR